MTGEVSPDKRSSKDNSLGLPSRREIGQGVLGEKGKIESEFTCLGDITK